MPQFIFGRVENSCRSLLYGTLIREPFALVHQTSYKIRRKTYVRNFCIIRIRNHHSYMTAVISGDTMEIYWTSENGDTNSLYWAGSFTAPDTADEPYKWISENDHSKTDMAMLASGDDTKEFTYQNGVISYTASALGTTKTVKLEKVK